jgi:hypothetical protein
MSKAPSLQVEESNGNRFRFPDLESAQRAALPIMSANLKNIVLTLLESGALIKTADGTIIPNPKKKP